MSATAAWSGEDAVTATHFVRDVLGPGLIGRPLAPIESHATEFDRVLRGNWFTKAGVSTALWDALARVRGVTVAELLGGPYRREVPVKISLSGDGDDLRAGYEAAGPSASARSRSRSGATPRPTSRVALARGWPARPPGRCRRERGWPLPSRSQPCRASPSRGSRSSSSRSTRTTSRVCATYAGSACARRRRVGVLGGGRSEDRAARRCGRRQHLRTARRSNARSSPRGLPASSGWTSSSARTARWASARRVHVACACERLGEIPHGIIGHHFYEEDRSLSEPSRSTASSLGCPRGRPRRRAERRGAAAVLPRERRRPGVPPPELDHTAPDELAAQVLGSGATPSPSRSRTTGPASLPAARPRQRADAEHDLHRARPEPLRLTRAGRRPLGGAPALP